MHSMLPQNCLLCGTFSGRAKLCADCAADLPYHPQACCPVCALPTLNGAICGHCLKRPPHFGSTRAAYTYAFPLDRLVQSLKYRHNLAVVSLLADTLATQAASHPLPDALIPMPLHPNRLRQRGFNQAHEIARHIARILRLPVLPHAATRIIDTAPQASLPLNERRKNLRGAFVCDHTLQGKRVAIVDDVLTSGSTLDALAGALLKAGALEVQCWVAARAVMQRNF
ncbi:amidophosphoribosyltransferase [Sulfuriferula plumbiphila]|uniref:Amidophosphoribosyltransferase n=1 Tax=Sulfuriferula plumbiphila TaxID=171865 RepID=A0A512L727_9PROT|nr:ComF family protein [Sulfuriferula plumbiphila]GEP30284.1 amidophosphoribosyltransferase [Sulfuriferula plumbiphila]